MVALMADEVDMLARLVENGFGAIREAVSDLRADIGELRETRDRDRDAAIVSRDQGHAQTRQAIREAQEENQRQFSELKAGNAATAAIALHNKTWIEEHGKPLAEQVKRLDGRIGVLEDQAALLAAETRGRKIAYATIGAIAGGALAATGTLVGSVGLDGLAAWLERGAKALSGGH